MYGEFENREDLPRFTESLRIFSDLSGHRGTEDKSIVDPVPLILRKLRARDPKQVSSLFVCLFVCLFICLFV